MTDLLLPPDEGNRTRGYRVGPSAIHGQGLFAARRYGAGETIGRYEGETTDEDDTHVLWVEDGSGGQYGVVGRNELRFLNHDPLPNAEFDGEHLEAVRAIEAGEEITFHYGEDWAEG